MTDNEDTSDDERDAIVGEVVEVISNREVIINVGEVDGAEVGMRFVILGETEVHSSRAPGGKLKVPYRKTEVKIVRFLDDLHSVGRTFHKIPGRKAASWSAVSLGFEETPDRVETLPVAKGTDLLSRLPAGSKTVNVGDRAEETWGEEFSDE